MKAIMISKNQFIVNTFCKNVHLVHLIGKILSIRTEEEMYVSTEEHELAGIPAFWNASRTDWFNASQKSQVFNLAERPELLRIFEKVANCLKIEYYEKVKWMESHNSFPLIITEAMDEPIDDSTNSNVF